MKQTITLGSVVDDGTGDYLRSGGIKINNNFNDIYSELGDGTRVHSAGAWKVHSFANDGANLAVKFGESYVVDTTTGIVNITLPNALITDVGKVIRIRDARGSWGLNSVFISANKNIKDRTTVEFSNQYSDLEFIYTGTIWQYAPQRRVNAFTFGDSPTVLRKAVLASSGQRDFDFYTELNSEYNTAAFEVYRRGNLMYYGDGVNEFSDYGSIPPHASVYYGDGKAFAIPDDWEPSTLYDTNTIVKVATGDVDDYDAGTWAYDYYRSTARHTSSGTFADDLSTYWRQLNVGDIYPPDGRTIRLTLKAVENDPIALVTYLTDISSFRSSVQTKTVKILDNTNLSEGAINGQSIKLDTTENQTITIQDMGMYEKLQFNPDTLIVELNGNRLTKAGDAGTSYGDNPAVDDFDVQYEQDDTDQWNTLIFGIKFKDGDILTVTWFDNVIGSLLEWDEGDQPIVDRGDARWLQSTGEMTTKNSISFTDNQPNAASVQTDSEIQTQRVETVSDLLNYIYPIGSMYFNSHNPSNPAEYMGFGTWVRYAQGRVPVGWYPETGGQYDSLFSLNNQFLNAQGSPRAVSGGIGGFKSVTLTSSNIPELTSGVDNEDSRDDSNSTEQYALVARSSSGTINLNGCQPDPDSNSISLSMYKEEPIKVNNGVNPTGVNIVQPFVTVHIWVRVA